MSQPLNRALLNGVSATAIGAGVAAVTLVEAIVIDIHWSAWSLLGAVFTLNVLSTCLNMRLHRQAKDAARNNASEGGGAGATAIQHGAQSDAADLMADPEVQAALARVKKRSSL